MWFTKSDEHLSKSEKAYRSSVRPLAFLLFLNGVGLIFAVSTWPAGRFATMPLPFIASSKLKMYFLLFLGFFNIVLGVGLYFRSRAIWQAFLGYLIIVPVWLILGIVFGYFSEIGPKNIIVPLATIFSFGLGIGLYFVTKPAFAKAP